MEVGRDTAAKEGGDQNSEGEKNEPARGSHEATRFETNQRGREGDGAVASGRRREGRGGRTREGESRWGGPERGSMGRTSREADQI